MMLQKNATKALLDDASLQKNFSGDKEGRQQPSNHIDFVKLLEEHKKRTEKNVPFTIQHVEDAIFVSNRHLISLEYIFYQKNANYTKIEPIKEQDEIKFAPFPLGTDNYKKSPEDSLKAFKKKPTNYREVGKDYLQNRDNDFLRCQYESVQAVEAMIVKYRVTPNGQIEFVQQRTIKFNGQFHHSKDQKMRLKLSQDQNIVSICYLYEPKKKDDLEDFEVGSDCAEEINNMPVYDKRQRMVKGFTTNLMEIVNNNINSKKKSNLQIAAWRINDFEEVEFSRQFLQELRDQEFGRLITMSFIGQQNEYILQIFQKFQGQIGKGMKQTKWIEYTIWNWKSGDKVLQVDNLNEGNENQVLFLGMLVFVPILYTEQHKILSEDISIQYDNELPQAEQEFKELSVALFYARPEYNISPVSKDQEHYQVINKIIPLQELIQQFHLSNQQLPFKQNKYQQIQNQPNNNINEFIMQQGLRKFDDLDSATRNHTNFWQEMDTPIQLPKKWFEQQDSHSQVYNNWQSNISISSTQSLRRIAFLNQSEKLYLAFNLDKCPPEEKIEPAKIVIQNNNKASHARNQMMKHHLFLIQKISHDESQVSMIVNQDQVINIFFDSDYSYCSPDINHYCNDENIQDKCSLSEQFVMQCVTISHGEQNIVLQTVQFKQRFGDFEQVKVERKVKTQDFSTQFPIFAYNIGRQKLILQRTLNEEGRQLIHELPKNESFVSFIKYLNLQQLGFFPTNLRIEACSQIVFLTLNNDTQRFFINILLIDPYYEDCQIALFKSNKTFMKNLSKNKCHDQILGSYIFSSIGSVNQKTVMEIKMLNQYHSCFSITPISHDNYDEAQIPDYSSIDYMNPQDDDAGDQSTQIKDIAPNTVKMDKRGNLYYIILVDGQCIIKQIKPGKSDIKSHNSIFEYKSQFCFGFDIADDGIHFFFIDDQKSIFVLKYIEDRKQLLEENTLFLKDKDIAHLKRKDEFEKMIISYNYLIYQSKIFYLYKDIPPPNGILDMEKLEVQNQNSKDESEKHSFQIGPMPVDGNNEFCIIYKDKKKFQLLTRFFMQPDSYDVSLIADYESQCEFSTFLWSGDILLKIKDRYMVFDKFGKFIYQVNFTDIDRDEMNKLLQKAQENPNLDPVVYSQLKKLSQLNNNIDISSAQKKKNSKNNQGKTPQKKRKEVNSNKFESEMGSLNLKIPQANVVRPTELLKQKTQLSRRGFQTNDYVTLLTRQSSDRFLDQSEISQSELGSEQELQQDLEEEEIISKYNRMRLFKMSRDNKCFLFEDRLKQEFKVYKLDHEIDHKNLRKKFFFRPLYVIDIMKLKIMAKFFSSKTASYETVVRHILQCGNFVITDNGNIALTFNSYDPKTQSSSFSIFGSFIKRDSKVKNQDMSQFDESCIQEQIAFDQAGVDGINMNINKQIEELSNLLEIESREQLNLPENLRDETRQKRLQVRIIDLKIKLRNIVWQEVVNGEMLVVYCGTHIQYSNVNHVDNVNQFRQVCNFVRADIKLRPETEILKIWGTSVRSQIQIIGKDHSSHTIIVITWDTNTNSEINMFQINIAPETTPENYIVRGMELNCNYFVHENLIFDLNTNLPAQATSGNSMKADTDFFKNPTVRKIYKDKSRMLGIDENNILKFPDNRMNYLLWKNIYDLGEKEYHIETCTTLEMYARTFDGRSFFHFFAKNFDVVEVMHNIYFQMKDNEQLTTANKYIPLVLLNPDENGNTALEVAHMSQRPRSFEMMINLLAQFHDFPFSKMIVTQLLKLVRLDVLSVKNFFENLYFAPNWVKEGVTIPWESSVQSYIFASNTSYITEELLRSEIELEVKDTDKNEPDQAYMLKSEMLEMTRFQKRSFRFLEEEEQNDHEADVSNSRISVSIINLEWIFDDDNLITFLNLLVNHAKKPVFKYKSIKSYIGILWKYYQPAIVQRVFYPYCIYLVTQMMMASGLASQYFLILKKPPEEQVKLADKKAMLGNIINTVSIIAMLLWLMFFLIEMRMLYRDPVKYLTAFSNIMDLFSQMTSISFQIVLNYTILTDNIIVEAKNLIVWGGFACTLLWIRMFKWMRLFQETAHFITLLSKVIDDLKIFNIMWLIVMAAFGNFAYTLNNNTEKSDDVHYVGNYSSIAFIDPVIEMYLFSIGEFDLDAYQAGPNHVVAFVLFILSSFVLNVIFQNLIISIIENSFQDVQGSSEEYSLFEQAKLVRDLIWIKNLKSLFGSKKYIVLLEKQESVKTDTEDIKKDLSDIQLATIRRQKKNLKQMTQKINDFDKRHRGMAKSIYTISLKYKEIMYEQEKKIDKLSKLTNHLSQKISDPLYCERCSMVEQQMSQMSLRDDVNQFNVNDSQHYMFTQAPPRLSELSVSNCVIQIQEINQNQNLFTEPTISNQKQDKKLQVDKSNLMRDASVQTINRQTLPLIKLKRNQIEIPFSENANIDSSNFNAGSGHIQSQIRNSQMLNSPDRNNFEITNEKVVSQAPVNSFQRRSHGFIVQANRSSSSFGHKNSEYDFTTPAKPLKIRAISSTQLKNIQIKRQDQK